MAQRCCRSGAGHAVRHRRADTPSRRPCGPRSSMKVRGDVAAGARQGQPHPLAGSGGQGGIRPQTWSLMPPASCPAAAVADASSSTTGPRNRHVGPQGLVPEGTAAIWEPAVTTHCLHPRVLGVKGVGGSLASVRGTDVEVAERCGDGRVGPRPGQVGDEADAPGNLQSGSRVRAADQPGGRLAQGRGPDLGTQGGR